MKRLLFRTLFLLFVLATLLQLSTCKLQQLAENSDGFKESDYLYYYLFIDSDIKNIPRTGGDYYFKFSGMDGPRPEMSSVIFRGGHNIKDLESYFKSLGYHLSNTGLDEGNKSHQIWRKNPSAMDEIRVFIDADVTVSKYRY